MPDQLRIIEGLIDRAGGLEGIDLQSQRTLLSALAAIDAGRELTPTQLLNLREVMREVEENNPKYNAAQRYADVVTPQIARYGGSGIF